MQTAWTMIGLTLLGPTAQLVFSPADFDRGFT